MSGKSRRRGRRLSRSQRRKLGRQVFPIGATPAAPTPATTTPSAVSKPAPTTQAAAPAPAAKAAVRTLTPASNVPGELKRIGLVGGIVVLIMVAAYFVLPLIWA